LIKALKADLQAASLSPLLLFQLFIFFVLCII